MSKSGDDPRTFVALDDPPEVVRSKFRKALTDCTSRVAYEPDSRPAVANLVAMHSLLTGQNPEEVCLAASDLDTGQFKTRLAEAAVSFLAPIQDRMRAHLSDRHRLWRLLEEGALKARQMAAETLGEALAASGNGTASRDLAHLARTAPCTKG
ncbi:tryptophanyl-tRNA synthetase, putative [Ixodes scapularis]|uniref:Tryptophanyl-tRNA synthetase, putative n=1 Tax=Ixodes scapularis TaxID=6945 RepID=B7QHC4_IXOSC|nr:tryptophanyl-tRNA synthetase, putative [Ixodes scapularis]|eukprot:XP_002414581.1 tryptophanyl-tRNA synthetase, putative [Ixodes scapularis]